MDVDIETAKAEAAARVAAASADLAALADFIHAHPEVAYQERAAAARIAGLLAGRGFAVTRGAGGVETAFVAVPDDAAPGGPTIAMLAEYDALPGLGHACGHNLIAAMSVGAALACRGLVPRGAGRVVVIGTPAEEGGGGKIRLLDAGVFRGVDAALMIHPWNRVRAHVPALGRMRFEVEFHGRAAHAASAPHRGVNALDALLQAFGAVALLRQQVRPDARIHGIITRGGESPNIIPALTAANVYVRAADPAYLRDLYDRVKACFEGAARATGCRVAWREHPDNVYEPVRENRPLADLFLRNLRRLGLAETGDDEPAGSTDFGNVSQRIPGLHGYLAVCDAGIDLHTTEFAAAAASARGRDAMLAGATALAMTALDLCLDEAALAAVRNAHA
ncbi:MAG TPA: M20 family metallopeptidase [Thermodesulfobacteriota bacterium]